MYESDGANKLRASYNRCAIKVTASNGMEWRNAIISHRVKDRVIEQLMGYSPQL